MNQGSSLRTTGCAGARCVPELSGALPSPGCRQEQRPPHAGRRLAKVPLFTAAHTSDAGHRTAHGRPGKPSSFDATLAQNTIAPGTGFLSLLSSRLKSHRATAGGIALVLTLPTGCTGPGRASSDAYLGEGCSLGQVPQT